MRLRRNLSSSTGAGSAGSAAAPLAHSTSELRSQAATALFGTEEPVPQRHTLSGRDSPRLPGPADGLRSDAVMLEERQSPSHGCTFSVEDRDPVQGHGPRSCLSHELSHEHEGPLRVVEASRGGVEPARPALGNVFRL